MSIAFLDCRANPSPWLPLLARKQWRVSVRHAERPEKWLLAAQKKEGGPVEAGTAGRLAARLTQGAIIVLTDLHIWLKEEPDLTPLVAWHNKTTQTCVVDCHSPRLAATAVLHMTGLLLGRPHCPDPLCAMWYPEQIQDIARPVVCPDCRVGTMRGDQNARPPIHDYGPE